MGLLADGFIGGGVGDWGVSFGKFSLVLFLDEKNQKSRLYSFLNASRARKIWNRINSLLGFVGCLDMLDCEVFSKLMGLIRLKQDSVLIGFSWLSSLK